MPQRPNVVVLMSDQQRLDTVSCYGLNEICKTPHIDALAERGVLEEHGGELIGAQLDAIKRAADRELFKAAMDRAGLEMPRG